MEPTQLVPPQEIPKWIVQAIIFTLVGYFTHAAIVAVRKH